MSFPNVGYVIGAEKSGTTTFTDLLTQHPSVSVSNPRDCDYFTRNYGNGIDWFKARFDHSDERFCVDVSLSYSNFPVTESKQKKVGHLPEVGVPKRIKQTSPNAKFVYIVRNPVARSYSSYWHAVRNGRQDKKVKLEEAVKQQPHYLDFSDYYGQIEPYLEYFDLESFHFVVFEEMIADPVAAVQGCLRFFGVEGAEYPLQISQPKNKSFTYNYAGSLIGKVFRTDDALDRFYRACKALIPSKLHGYATSMITSGIPEINAKERAFLTAYFADKNDKLRRLTGLPLEHWG